MFLRPQLWLILSEQERNIGNLVAFRTVICKKDVKSDVGGMQIMLIRSTGRV